MMSESKVGSSASGRIERIRRFNRFYTQRIGVLGQIGSNLPLPAARLIFEIESLGEPSSSEVSRALGLDPGYVSRLLSRLEREGLVEKKPCPQDRRRRLLHLTAEGRLLHQQLSTQANDDMAAMLEALDDAGQQRLIGALDTVETLLGGELGQAVNLREHGVGDIGWVLQRHGEFYRQAFGFDHVFEALVAKILAEFAIHQDAQRERLWIAEDCGQRLGSIMLVAEKGEGVPLHTSRLRLFFVEPHARGRGVGGLLMSTLFDFARRRGYRSIVLSTVDALDSARRLYERAGFEVVHRFQHQDWTVPVSEEEWRVELG